MRQVRGSSLGKQIGLIVVTAAVCFLIQLVLAALFVRGMDRVGAISRGEREHTVGRALAVNHFLQYVSSGERRHFDRFLAEINVAIARADVFRTLTHQGNRPLEEIASNLHDNFRSLALDQARDVVRLVGWFSFNPRLQRLLRIADETYTSEVLYRDLALRLHPGASDQTAERPASANESG